MNAELRDQYLEAFEKVNPGQSKPVLLFSKGWYSIDGQTGSFRESALIQMRDELLARAGASVTAKALHSPSESSVVSKQAQAPSKASNKVHISGEALSRLAAKPLIVRQGNKYAAMVDGKQIVLERSIRACKTSYKAKAKGSAF
jgi:hypothetical protein